MGRNHHPPPPTKFGPATAQAKPARTHGRHAPPTTPFGALGNAAPKPACGCGQGGCAPGALQLKARLPGPPPAAWNRAIPIQAKAVPPGPAIQRMERRLSVDLSDQAAKILESAKSVDMGVQEIQIMQIGENKLYSANSSKDWNAIEAGVKSFNTLQEQWGKAFLEARDEDGKLKKLPKGLGKLDNRILKTAVAYPALFDAPISLKGMKFAAGHNHAEQNLVARYVMFLHEKERSGTIGKGTKFANTAVAIYGAKPPCNRCRPVLKAFREAGTKYGLQVTFNETGASRSPWYEAAERHNVDVDDVPSLSADNLAEMVKFNRMEGKETLPLFAAFLDAYELCHAKEMGK